MRKRLPDIGAKEPESPFWVAPTSDMTPKTKASLLVARGAGLIGAYMPLRLRCLQLHVDILFLRVGQHLLETFFPADARLLVAAERRAEKMLRDLVDPDEASLHGGGGAVRGRQVIGPDRSGEPVFD